LGQSSPSPAILVLEDEALVAMHIEQEREDRGYAIHSLHARTGEAAARLEDGPPPDAARLDINTADGTSFELANSLAARNVPFIFLSGNESIALPEPLRDRPHLSKPIDFNRLDEMLRALVENPPA